MCEERHGAGACHRSILPGRCGTCQRGRVGCYLFTRDAQRPPGSPLDQYLTLIIDSPPGRLSENFAQPLDSIGRWSVALTASQAQQDVRRRKRCEELRGVNRMSSASTFSVVGNVVDIPAGGLSGRGRRRGGPHRCYQAGRRRSRRPICCPASSMPTSTSRARCWCRASSPGRRSCTARWPR